MERHRPPSHQSAPRAPVSCWVGGNTDNWNELQKATRELSNKKATGSCDAFLLKCWNYLSFRADLSCRSFTELSLAIGILEKCHIASRTREISRTTRVTVAFLWSASSPRSWLVSSFEDCRCLVNGYTLRASVASDQTVQLLTWSLRYASLGKSTVRRVCHVKRAPRIWQMPLTLWAELGSIVSCSKLVTHPPFSISWNPSTMTYRPPSFSMVFFLSTSQSSVCLRRQRHGPLPLQHLILLPPVPCLPEKHSSGIPAFPLWRRPVQCATVPSPNESIKHYCHWSAPCWRCCSSRTHIQGPVSFVWPLCHCMYCFLA